MSIIAGTAIESALGGYKIERSLRFNSADSAYLNRTFSTPTAGTKWTYSVWIKKNKDVVTLGHGGGHLITTAGSGAQGFLGFGWNVLGDITFGYGGYGRRVSSALFRDPSAWYHILVSIDTTQGTESNRAKLYVNGIQQTWTTVTAIGLNDTTQINQAVQHNIGRQTGQPYESLSANLTETHFIDGQALDPTSFGEFNTNTGVWQPITYAGTYGTNGFYINFLDNSNTTSTTLGKDYSGNSNNWTPNNFSVTAGVNNDSLVDTPTPYGTDTGVGGEVRGNYCTGNPLIPSPIAYTNGNLDAVGTGASFGSARSTFTLSTGKWYWEHTFLGGSNYDFAVGMITPQATTYSSSNVRQTGCYNIINNGPSDISTSTNGGGSVLVATTNWATNDVLMIAYDATAGYIWFGRNGTWYPPTNGGSAGNPAAGTNQTITAVSGLVPASWHYSTGSKTAVNFGQRPFAYTAPSGFKAVCTTNLPDPAIADGSQYFDVSLWTGTGSAQSITNSSGFQPDFVWGKIRSGADYHVLANSVVGSTKFLKSNTTDPETTNAQTITSFNSDGFSVGTSTDLNRSTYTFAGWQWKAGGTGVANGDGTIPSTVSANPTAGFSIVTYTGNGTAGATVGHGLSPSGYTNVPSMVIVKWRSGSIGVGNWMVYHKNMNATPQNGYLLLNGTGGYTAEPLVWNNTAPTSSVITLGAGSSVNSGTNLYVAYCFAPVSGYSAMGSFVGNNDLNGPFVSLGFRPKFIMVKSIASSDWFMLDADRPTFNVIGGGNGGQLAANQNYAESTLSTYAIADFLSNGFKVRHNMTYGYWNASGQTYIYAAFAENPFKYALAR